MYIDTMGNPQETYFCTRPRLASLLMENGFEGTRVPNPYDKDRPAWTFPATPESMHIVSNYFIATDYAAWKRRQGGSKEE